MERHWKQQYKFQKPGWSFSLARLIQRAHVLLECLRGLDCCSNDAKLGALAAILCEDIADRCGEEVAYGSRFKSHGGPTVGMIHARQGERLKGKT